ncbi:hypothetical protein AAHZ94_34910, partial [Streptomyces sp. HSW2009]|uniref:hypothetical protein n=1 Tax=Streptomyces sp. HSW2009 TaxID=3142890 RepID=UPI0032EEFF5A
APAPAPAPPPGAAARGGGAAGAPARPPPLPQARGARSAQRYRQEAAEVYAAMELALPGEVRAESS